MKRILLLFSALVASITALWAYDVKIDGIYYNLDKENKTAEVTTKDNVFGSNQADYSGSVTIPETITYNSIVYSVTSIGDDAFYFCSGLTSITIPNSVTSIGYSAFSFCSGLTSITIPNSVTSIGYSAFSFCSGLTSITIPNSVTSIGNRAFLSCDGLKNIIVSSDNLSYTSEDGVLFNKDKTALIQYPEGKGNASYTIPNSVTSIGDDAFYYCSGLTSITIPNSVTSIGDDAFYYCSGLTSITIPNSVTSISAGAFSYCSGLTSITIPNSVTSIGDDAFYYCSGLTSITIPNSVTSIGGGAFYYTGFYNSESNWDNGVLYIDNCLIGANSDVVKGSYTIKEGTRVIGESAFSGCSGLTSVTIGNSVTSIGSDAFYNCSRLTSVTIGNSVTSISEYAFYSCSGLTSVIWNAKNCEDFSSSTYSPFYNIRSNITSFTFGNEVEHIPAYLCYGMSKLTKITIPNSVTSIGSYAFSGCGGLTEVTIPNSVTSIGRYAFEDCSGLTSVIWNAKNCEDFSSYSSSPFYDIRSNITSFTFGNEVEHIPANLCYWMSKLTKMTIPNSVTSIGRYAFYNCSGLTKVNYLGTVDKWVEIDFKSSYSNPTYYAKDLYINNELLTDVKITTADSIKNYAFYNCQSIKSVEIGESVTSIGQYAFYNCSGLTKVNYLGTVDKWVEIDFNGYDSNPTYYAKDLYINNELITDVKITTADSIKNYAFYNCQSIKSVEIGNSVTTIGSYAFNGCSGLTSVIWNAKNCEDFSSSTYSPFYNIRSNITSFTFGNEVEHIPAYLCYEMSNLKTITIPNSVTSIGKEAFYGCSGLTSVIIGNSVTSIGSDAFYNCSGLTKVNYLGTVDKWVEIDFDDYDSNPTYYAKDLYINNELLTDVKITSADSIKDNAFINCASIKSVEIGNSVTSIGGSAFSSCSTLTSVSIGESVTEIGSSAFSGCDKLKKVTAYPTTVPSAYESSFCHYNAYLYVPCDYYEDYDLDAVFGSFKYIKCIAAEEVDAPDKVEIEVDEDNNANVIWPSTDGAKKYELEISKNGEVFCTLLFNENGQLTSIDFGNRSASVGFQFTVTGLDGASKYAYSMVAMDKKGNELQSYKGTFTTNGYVPGPDDVEDPEDPDNPDDSGDITTSATETLADANITVSNGTISADSTFSIYNTIGQDVTAFNGSLQPGIYVVALGADRVKVMIK